ncbi:glycoside hydrolase family 68 protein [Streptococcus sp. H31]|uniref:glycoside hydrolase family 68 protein n=1 Tax=Streptococcus huangxiaojuni TaxID=3237239 RepID=UPI0034A3FDF3
MKVRKIMRKSKKRWIVLTVATASLALAAQGKTAFADTVNSSEQETVTQTETVPAEANETAELQAVQAETDSSDLLAASEELAAENTDSEAPVLANRAANLSDSETEQTEELIEEGAVRADENPEPEADVPSDSAAENTVDPDTGLTATAAYIAQEAQLDISNLTDAQKEALNKIQLTSDAETGTQMTYKQFEEIANILVAQDPRYAIPYFNAEVIENMQAATTRDAQTGEIADLDVWDSWPVQDVRTGEVVNWNGYQLVIAMMGIPNTNDNHIYLLYNKYADNDFSNWKNAGSIFGYNQDAVTQQWSGSATVNDDGTIQLYYTQVDTSDNNSNNQKLASATLVLSFDDDNVYIDSVENDKVLTPGGGDGYYYQSYEQWRSAFTGADNIAMRDPHVIEDDNGDRYLIFEASTGTQNYQGEEQIYNWTNYGGDAAYNVQSFFRLLEDPDMYTRASISNAAIGILKLTGDVKDPEIAEYYTPLLTSPMVSDEIERPNVVKLGDKYYLFAASRLNHGSNNDAWNLANDVVGDNVVMLGYVSDSLTEGYVPLNDVGIVLTASVPADWRTATYSYYAVPVAGSEDTLLITSYMTNRNEVAGQGNNSTWAPSFLIQVLPDNTTRVLAKMTEQGDWIWDESSESQRTVGTLETAYLPGENDGYIDWNVVGGYGLIPHTPALPDEDTDNPNNGDEEDNNDKQNNPDNEQQEPDSKPSDKTISVTVHYNAEISGTITLTEQNLKDLLNLIARQLQQPEKTKQQQTFAPQHTIKKSRDSQKSRQKSDSRYKAKGQKKTRRNKSQSKRSAGFFAASSLSFLSNLFAFFGLKIF